MTAYEKQHNHNWFKSLQMLDLNYNLLGLMLAASVLIHNIWSKEFEGLELKSN